jgi:hypothetical protein
MNRIKLARRWLQAAQLVEYYRRHGCVAMARRWQHRANICRARLT